MQIREESAPWKEPEDFFIIISDFYSEIVPVSVHLFKPQCCYIEEEWWLSLLLSHFNMG